MIETTSIDKLDLVAFLHKDGTMSWNNWTFNNPLNNDRLSKFSECELKRNDKNLAWLECPGGKKIPMRVEKR